MLGSGTLFETSKAKVNRAEHHLQTLLDSIAEFISAGKHRPIWKMHPETGERRVLIEKSEPLPCVWPYIIGDVVHNLRASLDLLACEIVRLSGHSPEKVYFPFAKSHDTLQKAIKDSGVKKAGSAVVHEFNSIKPYNDGNSLLRGLHDLDLIDKHNTIIVITQAAWVQFKDPTNGPKLIFEGGHEVVCEEFWAKAVNPGDCGELTSLTSSEWLKVENEHVEKAQLVVTFPNRYPFHLEDVLQTLSDIRYEVADTIEKFEKHFT